MPPSKRKKAKKTVKKNPNNSKLIGIISLLVVIFMAIVVIWYFFKKYDDVLTFNTETYRVKSIIAHHRSKVFGIDISHYQKKETINWQALHIIQETIPISFVVLRATMGSNATDKHFHHFWKTTKHFGYIRGAYHFYRPDENPIKQARNYLSVIRLESCDMFPILDVETVPSVKTEHQFLKDVETWLEIVEQYYGKPPIIYTSAWFYTRYLKKIASRYPLWIANYNVELSPIDGENWKIWQFSDKGEVRGIDGKVDINVFNGDISELKQLTLP